MAAFDYGMGGYGMQNPNDNLDAFESYEAYLDAQARGIRTNLFLLCCLFGSVVVNGRAFVAAF